MKVQVQRTFKSYSFLLPKKANKKSNKLCTKSSSTRIHALTGTSISLFKINTPFFFSPLFSEYLESHVSFVGTKFFPAFLWGINIYGGVKIKWESNISYYTFISFNSQKSKVFFLWISSGNLNTSGVANLFWRQVLWKKCSVSCIFQTIVVIVVIKILEKYLWRSSVLERNF